MKRSKAMVGSAVFLIVAPGTVAGLLPWLITRWHMRSIPDALSVPARVLGAALVVGGAGFVINAFVRFVIEGLGTPMPAAPPKRLVVGGLYRYVRNPMYLAVMSMILGQVLLVWQPVLLLYAAAMAAQFYCVVRLYEEPSLARKFGADYVAYRKAVPGWWPRLRPWRPDSA